MDIISNTKDQIVLGNTKAYIFLENLAVFVILTVSITFGSAVYSDDAMDNTDKIIAYSLVGIILIIIIYVFIFFDNAVTINRNVGRIIIEKESIIKYLFSPREIPFSDVKGFKIKHVDFGSEGEQWELDVITNNNRSVHIFYNAVEQIVREVTDKISDLTGKVVLEIK